MMKDRFDFSASTTDMKATQAFEGAVFGLAAHRPETGPQLEAALAADPNHVGAFALRGFANLILARSELVPNAAKALDAARGALAARDGGTDDERVLVSALDDAANISFAEAARTLDRGFAHKPAAFLPFKIAQALRFMTGDARGMLESSTRALTHWSQDMPAAGFILGCHAFALEEHGHYDEAELIGRRAVSLEPNDSWGLHAVSHVHEMRGATGEGIDWLEQSRRAWSRCNNFSFHMAWHLALLHLEQGDHERVLDIYDEDVRPTQTDDFRDMANAVSLLWRLNQSGVHVGSRWQDLAEVARRRRTDTTLIFAAMHNLAALVAIGDYGSARELLVSIEERAMGPGDQARVAGEVGVPLGRILSGLGTAADRQMLDHLVRNMPKLGGSNAQRDFFVLALAKAAGLNGDAEGLSRIRQVRRGLKAEDRLMRSIEIRAMH
nr:tetratricopeptide repeat protein [uncultured Gellertiella sp.]